MKQNKQKNYYFIVALFGLLFGSTILFIPLLNTFLTGESISIYSYALINFSGYLFFTMTFVELLFIKLIILGGNPLFFTLVAIITALAALTLDYFIGYTFSRAFLTKIISEKKLNKYQKRIEKYGDLIIFIFNVFPLSSPLLTLTAGLIRYNFKRLVLFSAFGLIIKYSALAIFFVRFY